MTYEKEIILISDYRMPWPVVNPINLVDFYGIDSDDPE